MVKVLVQTTAQPKNCTLILIFFSSEVKVNVTEKYFINTSNKELI